MNPIKTFLLPAKGSPLLQNLMQQSLWRQGDEDDQWAQRAVEHLIKKIKKNKGALEALEQAVIRHDETTPCVTIQRSLDGRLQVSHRKGLPHVIYCRVWRWPDLQSHHELRPVKHCRHPFNATQQRQQSTSAAAENNNGSPVLPDVCINPYHYERVESPVLPPVLVPRRSEFAPFMSFLPGMNGNSPQQQQQQFPPPHSYSSPTLLQQPQQQAAFCTTTAHMSPAYYQHPHYSQSPSSAQQQLRHSQTYSPLPQNNVTSGAPSPSSRASEFSDLGSPPHTFSTINGGATINNGFHTTAHDDEDDDMVDVDQNIARNSNSSRILQQIHMTLHGSSSAAAACSSGPSTFAHRDPAAVSADVVPVDYEEAENWCVIAYYEFNNRVGELFHARRIHVVVDGFTVPARATTATRTKSSTFEMSSQRHPAITSGASLSNGNNNNVNRYHRTSVRSDSSSTSGGGGGDDDSEDFVDTIDRFSLGTLANVTRSVQVEQCRQAIGKGVHLYYVGGEVYAEVLSNSSMFVQSRLSNMKNKFHPMTVCKIPPGCSIKIFSNQYFATLLHEKACESYEAVFELNKLCTIRMSLVKGWGADYSRNDVTATPCWIEIRLNGPLGWLDRVLSHMPPPPNLISSRS